MRRRHVGSGAGGRRVDPSQRRRRRWTARGHGCRRDPDRWVGTKRRGRRGREAPATANRHRRASKADQRTSPRRKSPWRQRSRAASGRRHRGLRAPRSASMAWALRALGLRPPSSVGQVGLQNRVPQTFVGLRNWLYYLNRWIPRRDQRPDFWDAFSRAKHDPSSFAVGGKGLASAAGAANARKNGSGFWDNSDKILIQVSRALKPAL